MAEISDALKKKILRAQKNEITEFHIYKNLAKVVKDSNNRELMESLARDEKQHYEFWKKYTGQDVKPDRWAIFKFFWICRIFGMTFGIKLMENGESKAQSVYAEIAEVLPESKQVLEDEEAHERKLIALINEEKLEYIGSIVLGLNDALIELTGTLAGLTFALQNTRMIAVVGLITGIAASFSMAASEYLSTKSDGEGKHPLRSSLYTGMTYIVTVILLILPYLLLSHYIICLVITLVTAVLIIFVFNYYISVVKELPFRKRFLEMAFLSLGVAGLSFGIGSVVRLVFGIDV